MGRPIPMTADRLSRLPAIARAVLVGGVGVAIIGWVAVATAASGAGIESLIQSKAAGPRGLPNGEQTRTAHAARSGGREFLFNGKPATITEGWSRRSPAHLRRELERRCMNGASPTGAPAAKPSAASPSRRGVAAGPDLPSSGPRVISRGDDQSYVIGCPATVSGEPGFQLFYGRRTGDGTSHMGLWLSGDALASAGHHGMSSGAARGAELEDGEGSGHAPVTVLDPLRRQRLSTYEVPTAESSAMMNRLLERLRSTGYRSRWVATLTNHAPGITYAHRGADYVFVWSAPTRQGSTTHVFVVESGPSVVRFPRTSIAGAAL